MDRETWTMLITTVGTLAGLVVGGGIALVAMWLMSRD